MQGKLTYTLISFVLKVYMGAAHAHIDGHMDHYKYIFGGRVIK